MHDELKIETPGHTVFVPLSQRLAAKLRARDWREGLLFVYVPHTTAGITIQENADPDVIGDLERVLERLVPWRDGAYRHAEGNTAAHVKAALLGSSVQVPVAGARLVLGRWQEVYLAEFDGPRTRRLHLSFLGTR